MIGTTSTLGLLKNLYFDNITAHIEGIKSVGIIAGSFNSPANSVQLNNVTLKTDAQNVGSFAGISGRGEIVNSRSTNVELIVIEPKAETSVGGMVGVVQAEYGDSTFLYNTTANLTIDTQNSERLIQFAGGLAGTFSSAMSCENDNNYFAAYGNKVEDVVIVGGFIGRNIFNFKERCNYGYTHFNLFFANEVKSKLFTSDTAAGFIGRMDLNNTYPEGAVKYDHYYKIRNNAVHAVIKQLSDQFFTYNAGFIGSFNSIGNPVEKRNFEITNNYTASTMEVPLSQKAGFIYIQPSAMVKFKGNMWDKELAKTDLSTVLNVRHSRIRDSSNENS
jgi:hypothetical protein